MIVLSAALNAMNLRVRSLVLPMEGVLECSQVLMAKKKPPMTMSEAWACRALESESGGLENSCSTRRNFGVIALCRFGGGSAFSKAWRRARTEGMSFPPSLRSVPCRRHADDTRHVPPGELPTEPWLYSFRCLEILKHIVAPTADSSRSPELLRGFNIVIYPRYMSVGAHCAARIEYHCL